MIYLLGKSIADVRENLSHQLKKGVSVEIELQDIDSNSISIEFKLF